MSSSVHALSDQGRSPVVAPAANEDCVQPSYAPSLFALEAIADPGMLPRIVHEFAKRDIIPTRLNVKRNAGMLEVSVAADDLPPDVAALIANKLRVIPWVQVVRLNGDAP